MIDALAPGQERNREWVAAAAERIQAELRDAGRILTRGEALTVAVFAAIQMIEVDPDGTVRLGAVTLSQEELLIVGNAIYRSPLLFP